MWLLIESLVQQQNLIDHCLYCKSNCNSIITSAKTMTSFISPPHPSVSTATQKYQSIFKTQVGFNGSIDCLDQRTTHTDNSQTCLILLKGWFALIVWIIQLGIKWKPLRHRLRWPTCEQEKRCILWFYCPLWQPLWRDSLTFDMKLIKVETLSHFLHFCPL